METRVVTKEMKNDALATAEVVHKIDELFDLLNSRMPRADKVARCAITNDDQLLTLNNYLSWIRRWSFENTNSKSRIMCQWGLVASITSIIALTRKLLKSGFSFVCTSRFNQDCIENYFAGISSRHGSNENPSPLHFCQVFRSSLVLSCLDSTSTGKNCVSDEDWTLLSLSDDLQTDSTFEDNMATTDTNAQTNLQQLPLVGVNKVSTSTKLQ